MPPHAPYKGAKALLVGCFPVSPPHLAASIFTPVLHKLQQGQREARPGKEAPTPAVRSVDPGVSQPALKSQLRYSLPEGRGQLSHCSTPQFAGLQPGAGVLPSLCALTARECCTDVFCDGDSLRGALPTLAHLVSITHLRNNFTKSPTSSSPSQTQARDERRMLTFLKAEEDLRKLNHLF